MMDVKIEQSWKEQLAEEFDKEYFKNIVSFLKQQKAEGKIIYPSGLQLFNAFALTPFNQVKAVLIGQDPYHGAGQAHGLCFSVLPGIKPPPSLVNIFKELQSDIGAIPPQNGFLEQWAQQGLLMLNTSLTVEAGKPMSHANIGWESFTDAVIKKISEQKRGIVFLLWGKFAQSKEALINTSKHFVLKAAHPSPYSANAGFFWCKHFSKTNEILMQQGIPPIDWQIR